MRYNYLTLLLFLTLGCFSAKAADINNITPKYELINKAEFPTNDLAVATLNVMDYGADNTGSTDCSGIIQALLNYLGDRNDGSTGYYYNNAGGTLYLPAGKYLCKKNLVLPRGVTLRGDWKKPGAGVATTGTVILVQTPTKTVNDENQAFIVMQPSSEVSNINFFYPNQSSRTPYVYPPTILYGQRGYFGNDYCNVRHCTFINSYIGIQFSSYCGGGCPNVFDVYGTPLHQGIVMDNIADVGRLDGIHFSPIYWEGCGYTGSPQPGALNSYIENNATGIVMRRNDWSYTCNFTADHYMVGFSAEPSSDKLDDNSKGKPNGHNYNFQFTNCQKGILVTASSGAGIMFTRVKTENCVTGVELQSGAEGPIQLYGCDLAGTSSAIYIEKGVGSSLIMQDCKTYGKINAMGGQLIAHANVCNQDVNIGPDSRTIFTKNTMASGAKLNNSSIYTCEVSDDGPAIKSLPEFKDEWMAIKTTRPARTALYVVTDFGAQPVKPAAQGSFSMPFDNTTAIQSALDKAGQEGGGIVYLPTGHYRVDGVLNIPTGVELKGSSDLATVPKRNGAILETTANEGNENGTPFITMQPSSGLRGVTIDYPNNGDPMNVKKYPYAVRGNKDVYIVNVGIRTAYHGVNLFTNKCDNHYVDYLAGHAFTNVIRVGGNSENGIISNIQCNTNVFACADETKYGLWPNSLAMKNDALQQKAYGQNEEDLEFMMIGDTKNQILYNNFLFGCNKGMWFINDGNGGATDVHSLGNAVDGAVHTVVVDGIGSDLNLINSQIVALNHNKTTNIIKGEESASFYRIGKGVNHAINLFASDNWGGGDYFTQTEGGIINFYLSNIRGIGAKYTFSTANNAKINVLSSVFENPKSIVHTMKSDEKNMTINSSVLSLNSGMDKTQFAQYVNNLPKTWSMSSTIKFLDRKGWKATSCTDPDGVYGQDNGAILAIDNKPTTWWDSEDNQGAYGDDWFQVEFGKSETFNTVIMDTSKNPTNGPCKYVIEVWNAAINDWKTVTSGENGGAITVASFPNETTTKFRIRQVGTKEIHWRIQELNIAKLDVITGIKNIKSDAVLGEVVAAQVFTLNGVLLLQTGSNVQAALNGLQPGAYIIVLKDKNEHKVAKKVVIQ